MRTHPAENKKYIFRTFKPEAGCKQSAVYILIFQSYHRFKKRKKTTSENEHLCVCPRGI